MKINKVLAITLVITMFSILAMSGVFAAVTIVGPGASAVLSGTAVLNATGVNLDNCTFYAKSASTANSSWSYIGYFTNKSSTDATFVNGTFSSLALQDASDYIFNATCRNLTNSVHDGTRSGITINNTVPQAPTLSPATNTMVSSTGTQTFTGTVVDANTTGCTYTIYRNGGSSDGNAGTATYSGSTCTFTKDFTTTADNGNWYWVITATDGLNTASTEAIMQVQLPSLGGGVPAGVTVTQNPQGQISVVKPSISSNPIVWIIVGIVVVIVIAVLINRKR